MRNDKVTSLAGQCKKLGMSVVEAVESVKQINKSFNPPLPEEEILETITGIYERYPEDEIDIPLVDLGDVEYEETKWLWHGWLPEGKIAILGGLQGEGKSYIALDIALTILDGGVLPDGTKAEKSNVAILGFEDDLKSTQKGRALSLGHTGKGLLTLDWSKMKTSLVASDPLVLRKLEQIIRENDLKLMVFDTFSSMMSGVNDSKSTSVRPILLDLAKISEETGCCFLFLMHMSKRTEMTSQIHQLAGSFEYSAVARAMHFIAPQKDEDGDETDTKVFFNVKNNLTRKATPLEFLVKWNPETKTSDGIQWSLGDYDFDYI